MTRGADIATGRVMSGRDYTRQCLVDALLTPLGSRVMRPSYGSRLFSLLGRGGSEEGVAEIVGAITETVVNCLSGVVPRQVVLKSLGKEGVVFDLSYYEEATLEVVEMRGVEVIY